MTVEEIRGNLGTENDRFPVGMRVLAVDDDPTCLMLLEGLLRKCQYQVTTTNQARTALKMLRENKSRFDLVISDVHMPDMDGFKLLELVGLEMDLPVIMLSANSDTKLVMKGVTHGACDYLVKPVRLEELRNIWQHVIRRKKLDSKHQNKLTSQDKSQQVNGEGEQGPVPAGNADQSGKLNRKRKDEEEEGEENEHENEDPATQKKPRVVWSIDLHRKFVAAVNQLGIEKAVPKRILDLMNVEGLTRENVASHLQKYRLYLKRISSVATQQANMVAAFSGKDSSFMRMSSLDGLGDFRTLAGPGRFSNPTLSSYQASGMLGRLNSAAGMNLRGLSSSSLIQPNLSQNLGTSVASFGKFQNPSLFQGIPNSLDLDQTQRNKPMTQIAEFGSTEDPTGFNTLSDNKVGIGTSLSSYVDTRPIIGSSTGSLPSASSNPMILPGNNSPQQNGGLCSNQSSLKVGSLNSEPFNTGISGSNFLDSIPNFSANPSPLNNLFSQERLASNNMRINNSSAGPLIQSSPLDFSSTSSISASVENSRGEIQCQAGLVGDVGQNMNQATDQMWGEHKQEFNQNPSQIYRPLHSVVPANVGMSHINQGLDQNSAVCHRTSDTLFGRQLTSSASTLLQQSEIEKSALDSKLRSSEDYLLEQVKSHGGFVQNGYDPLDDIMNAIKREQEGTMLMDGEFGIDAYSFGSCL
ncbi:hypothetical protein NMG60_11013120 [Bertholletia excelsa]